LLPSYKSYRQKDEGEPAAWREDVDVGVVVSSLGYPNMPV
jgi:hypothetical protein